MRYCSLIATIAVLLTAVLIGPARAQPKPLEAAGGTPVAMSGATSNAKRIDFTSQVNGRAYRLFVSVPDRPAPPEGYPVIYLIDGNLHFGITVDTARIQSRWRGVKDPVVVGIGYQTDDVLVALTVRNRDLTHPVTPDYLKSGFMEKMPPQAPASFGGIDAYLQMVETEVKPRIAGLVKLDPNDQTLMGHSLGGLTTLHALFTRPQSYNTYVAISPSIWWGHGLVLANEAPFAEQVRAGKVRARLLMPVGGQETANGGTTESEMGIPQAAIDAMMRETEMVGNVQQLTQRLAKVAGPGFSVSAVVLTDENHNSVPPAGIARGVRFAMRP